MDPPEEGVDFAFDIVTDPSNPDVWFKTGSSTISWRVWSQVSASDTTPGNLGDLFIDSTGTTDNYKVELKNPNTGGAGAANVGWIALADADKKWTGWSSITGGSISGDLTYLEVVQVAGFGGQVSNFTVGRDTLADLKIPDVVSLSIGRNAAGAMKIVAITGGLIVGGDLSGDVTVAGSLDGQFHVYGTVNDVVIDINDTTSAASLIFDLDGDPGESVFDADLILRNGIGPGAFVEITGTLPAGRKIDLNNAGIGVYGTLLLGAGAGDIVRGGDIALHTSVRIALYSQDCQSPNRFSGTATFNNVASEIGVLGANLDGLIHVTGDLTELIPITEYYCPGDAGHLLPNGKIWVEGNNEFGIYVQGDARGTIQVDGDVDGGSIWIESDLSGDIDVEGAIASTGGVSIEQTLQSTGRILIDGLCDGSIEIGQETETLSLIYLKGGLGTAGDVTVNGDQGDYDANGTIQVGTAFVPCQGMPDPVTFDGGIMITTAAALMVVT